MIKLEPEVIKVLDAFPPWAKVIPELTIEAVGPQPCKKTSTKNRKKIFFITDKYEIFTKNCTGQSVQIE